MASTPIGSGRALFDLPDFRIWAMNGAPRLTLINQNAAARRRPVSPEHGEAA